MDSVPDYILERIRILEDDCKYWNEKYLNRAYNHNGLFALAQIKIKRAIIAEFEGVLGHIKPQVVRTIKDNSGSEFVAVELTDLGVKVTDDKGDKIWFIGKADGDEAVQLVEMFREVGMAARLKTTKLVHCPICEWYHPSDSDTDCRDDGYRFPTPDDPDDEADYFDDGSPGLNVHKPRTTYRNGDHLDDSRGGCDQCRAVMINGVFCHETGCPDAWKDKEIPCFECGCGFFRSSVGQRVCEDCLNPPDED